MTASTREPDGNSTAPMREADILSTSSNPTRIHIPVHGGNDSCPGTGTFVLSRCGPAAVREQLDAVAANTKFAPGFLAVAAMLVRLSRSLRVPGRITT